MMIILFCVRIQIKKIKSNKLLNSKNQIVGIIVHTNKKTRSFKAFDECFDSLSAVHVFCYLLPEIDMCSALCKSRGADLYLCVYHS